MASKMRSMGLHADSQACERPRLSEDVGRGASGSAGTLHAPPPDLREMIGIVPKVRYVDAEARSARGRGSSPATGGPNPSAAERPLMQEEGGDHYQYRQYAKANHCNSKTDVRQETAPKYQAGANGCLSSHRW
jgi:hypothetical protein